MALKDKLWEDWLRSEGFWLCYVENAVSASSVVSSTPTFIAGASITRQHCGTPPDS